MTRDYPEQRQDLIPNVQIPAIQLRPFGEGLYVQINVTSLVYTSLQKNEITTWQGFLFEVKMPRGRMLTQRSGKSWDEYIDSLLHIETSNNSLPKNWV